MIAAAKQPRCKLLIDAEHGQKEQDVYKRQDYVEKKQVKKVNGGKPGFVIYHTNYSMVIDSDISGIRQVKEK